MSAEASRFDGSQGTMTADGDSKTSLGSRIFGKEKEEEDTPCAPCGCLAARRRTWIVDCWPTDGRGYQLLNDDLGMSAPDVILTLRQKARQPFQGKMELFNLRYRLLEVEDENCSIFTLPGSQRSCRALAFIPA
jgi:hypothetical protein